MEPKKVMFAGSFDPFHDGHKTLVLKALKLFDEVIIVVSRNPEKTYQFDALKRKAQIEVLYTSNPRVSVVINENELTATFAKKIGVSYLLRGFRNEIDFAYETKIARFNKMVNPDLELVYFFSEAKDENLSSTTIKEIEKYKKDYQYE